MFASCATKTDSNQIFQNENLIQNKAVVQGKLDNGIEYFVMKNSHPENRIELKLVVKAGSTLENDDQRGVAHLIEHMAFNGTEHFERNSLVDYFELIGMDFGAEVNAYTSFDETVYRLRVPADNPEMLKTALLVFRDWACAITFDQTELDKERGVVTEEWRLGRGLKGRISDAEIPFLLRDSRYASRLPIGTMDVIKNIPRERVLDFYKKWYRPEYMSVIVVGDADPSVLEKAVKETMQDIPSSKEELTHPVYNIPFQSEKDILVFKDKEQPYPLIQILSPDDIIPVKTTGQFRDSIIESIAISVFNERLASITATPDSPWLDAAAWNSGLTHFTSLKALGFVPKEDFFESSFSTILDEYEVLCRNGILENELKRAKNGLLSSAEQLWKNKDLIESEKFASSIADFVLTGTTFISTADKYQLYKKLVPGISIEEVNSYLRNFLPDRGTYLLAILPQDAKDIPDKKGIEEFWNNYQSTSITEKADFDSDRQICQRPQKNAKISATAKNAVLGTKEITLENGMKVILKPTKNNANKINIKAYKKGGLSLYEDEDYPSGDMASAYACYSGINDLSYPELMKVFSGKQIDVDFGINDYSTVFTAASSNEDSELVFQFFYQLMTNPRFTDEGWNTLYAQLSQMAASHGTRPEDSFNDKINELLYNSSLRKISCDNRFLSSLNRKTAEQIFRSSFSNAADFTFIITGDFNEKKIIDFSKAYLGNLPSKINEETSAVWREPDFPSAKPSAVVKKGLDQQSKVFIAFGTPVQKPETAEKMWEEKFIASQLGSYFQIKLREVIREDKSGSYGVSVRTELITNPECFFTAKVYFSCEPGREQELADEVIKQIKLLHEQTPDESYVTKLNESYRRNKEVNLKNDSYISSSLLNICVLKNAPETSLNDFDTLPAILSAEKLQQTAQKYLNTENYVTVILSPEK